MITFNIIRETKYYWIEDNNAKLYYSLDNVPKEIFDKAIKRIGFLDNISFIHIDHPLYYFDFTKNYPIIKNRLINTLYYTENFGKGLLEKRPIAGFFEKTCYSMIIPGSKLRLSDIIENDIEYLGTLFINDFDNYITDLPEEIRNYFKTINKNTESF